MASVTLWKVIFGLMAFAAVGVGCYAIGVYCATLAGALKIGTLTSPLAPGLRSQPAAIYIHAFASGAALILCGLQIMPVFRQWTSVRTHRWLGRVYGVCVLFGGCSGLALSRTAVGGATSTAGFASLAVLWMTTTLAGSYAAYTGRVALHARLLSHSTALTFAAVTLRIYLPIAIFGGGPFEVVYSRIAWACWLPNVMLVEAWYWLGSTKGKQPPMPALPGGKPSVAGGNSHVGGAEFEPRQPLVPAPVDTHARS